MVNVKNHKISIIYFHKFIYSLFDSIVTLLLVFSKLISMIKKRKWENCTNSFSNKNKKIIKSVICIWIHINFCMPIWYLKVILFISYVFTFINKFLPECFFFTIWVLFFNNFLFTRHAQWPVVIEATNLSCTKTVSSESRHWTEIMIPPNASLVKYDNPVLVSRNTDKKTPRVCFNKNTSIAN